MDAKRQTYTGEGAWNVVAGADKIFVASGKKIVEFDPATSNKEEMLKKITGRTGNLRAPTLITWHRKVLYLHSHSSLLAG